MANRIEQDVRSWDAIDEHRTGTAGDAATSAWLAEQIHQAGALAEVDWFPFTRRVPGVCQVSDGEHRSDGLPLFDGASTPDQGVTGAAVLLENPATLDGDASPIGVTLFGPTLRDPGARTLEEARHKGGYSAIIAIAAGNQALPGLSVQNAEAFSDPFGPPVLQVATSERDWLLAAASAGAHLSVHAELTDEETRASNVQCRIDGLRTELAPLVIMTPKSAWWTCTAERAGGIALWLNMIRYFAAAPPERTVIFTANTGHELGHVGLDHYLEENPDLVAGAHAWVHLGANFATRDAAVLYQASSQALMRDGLAALTSRGISEINTTPVGNRPLGEARNVFDGGGAYISLIGANPWFHHPDDRWPVSVDLDKLERISEAVLQMAVTLASA